ncbi:MAG TPA: hypothetical protein VGR63_17355 [Casimicrobiaceae bacterium]|jgi:hypothetical protein|nr:hypothetical protein [Casimicrobiaceae bacterium]
MTRRRVAIVIAATLALAACAAITSSTRVTQSAGEAKHPYRKLAVIAMSASKAERQVFDDALVARLAAAGVNGIVGDRYIEDAAVANGISPMEAIRAAGADGVIYVWLRPDAADVNLVPSAGAWGWTVSGSVINWYPADVQVRPLSVKFEVRLYDVETQQLAWSAYVTKLYPKSLDADAPQVADGIVRELAGRGFIAR